MPGLPSAPALPALFSLALFLSAALLFTVELMIAKMILPLFGGTPAVWNTCMMFFQAVLLAGYGYAHLLGTRVGTARQIAVQLTLLAAACIVLPVAVPRQWAPSPEGNPAAELLVLLLITVGPPFFVLSSIAPLLQRWFARTGHPAAVDPYFLYSASNLGSMLALISYPAWVEPHLRLAGQGCAWTAGYVAVLFLTALCAAALWRWRSACPTGERADGEGAAGGCDVPAPLGRWEQGRWVLLAFVPSSLMLGVTSFLSTDVAAVPLFWVVPLALYLLSFIIVFARVPAQVHRISVWLLPLTLLALFLADFSDLGLPKWGVFSVHLVNFFMVSMVCHGEIARTRPAAGHLTVFYLWISVGGVLGGIFNSLVAPVVFPALFEYPAVLVLAALLVPAGRRARPAAIRLTWKEPALYLGTPLVLAPLVHYLTTDISVAHALHTFLIGLPFSWKAFSMIVNFGFPALACAGLLFLKRPLLFGIGFAAIFVTMTVQKDLELDIVHRQRNFFGVLTVSRSFDGSFMNLSHGTTLHGKQWLSPFHRREPASYYHRHGPAGEVFAEFDGTRKKKRIAVTGLGAGTLAVYAGAGQEIDFYEINPMVKRIATNAKYFTYLSDCRARWRIILGDARLTLAEAPSGRYGLVVLDAFSSDSIPVHLLTREAVALYLSKIEPAGVLLVHITNRYVDLAPVLARLVQEQGFACRLRDDEREFETGKDGSTWVVIARSERDLGGLARNGAWKKMAPRPGVGVWTDDFSNLLSVFKW